MVSNVIGHAVQGAGHGLLEFDVQLTDLVSVQELQPLKLAFSVRSLSLCLGVGPDWAGPSRLGAVRRLLVNSGSSSR
jgi:hypothetical protein